ncbi:Palmitoyltransferase [Spironucleus salmonicida]|uniref:Palmitoyltransferase n=1 Tax=Spironucleus salmonicida TaxID=348837 RepID=V6LYH2_9EUKA|nr:Palmitoyltransferase [Spironucleus salmonicida]|eukprot:EST48766.1 DHHC zinc finger and transmembrane domain-containing protein [Spironucleus salmonicida]
MKFILYIFLRLILISFIIIQRVLYFSFLFQLIFTIQAYYYILILISLLMYGLFFIILTPFFAPTTVQLLHIFIFLNLLTAFLAIFISAPKNYPQKNRILTCKFCERSKAHPFTHHCRRCKTCISGFDHHCSILGVCIGAENFIFFAKFFIFSIIEGGLQIFFWDGFGSKIDIGIDVGFLTCLKLIAGLLLILLGVLGFGYFVFSQIIFGRAIFNIDTGEKTKFRYITISNSYKLILPLLF